MNHITFDDFDTWCKTQPEFIRTHAFFNEAEYFEEEGARFFKGDYHTDLLSVSPCVVVEGNLTTDTFTWDYDCGLLVVTGNLHCKHFQLPVWAVIGGNLHAETVQINSCCDFALHVGGDLIAQSVIEDGHCIEVVGDIRAAVIESRVNHISTRGVTLPRVGLTD
ncbi:hypothetical protein [Chitinivorax sp. B]|uniref:hypothetical protein n=1 Tax=Chitinivorax sp. B TaxID=2502235 RepID=UPI0010F89945|nr:hypothetical protein [Chitinivorax sp. B]